MTDNEHEELARFAKRRGFFSQTSGSYGGTAGFYTFGPEGTELKNRIVNVWRDKFVREMGNREISAPTVMEEIVFQASGHAETFDDMIIECGECGSSHRADHLVEDHTDIEEAESLSNKRIEEIIEENDILCPTCGQSLVGEDVEDFNLMFSTQIGPGDSNKGYLRPETAQGIFTEFPEWRNHQRGKLPFGIAQVGRSYRNEISPRKNIVRVREFTQAELEYFIDREDNSPELSEVEDIEVTLYSRANQQNEDGEPVRMTIREAVDREVIGMDWVAYFIGKAKEFYLDIGIDESRLRFRQHLDDEMAHYATDCWDAEAEVDGDWIEITGIATRGCYDLAQHEEYSGEDYTVFKELEDPVEVEKEQISFDMSELGPKFGEKSSKITEKAEELVSKDPSKLEQDEITLEFEDEEFSISTDNITREIVKETKEGERIHPFVVEPSFGVGRIVYSVMAHCKESDTVDGEERSLFSIPEKVAPNAVAVFPLMDKDELPEKAQEITQSLRKQGIQVIYDETGAIGKRYRRQDEIGTPYCITVDYDTLEDGSVTLRDRDSTEQKRVQKDRIRDLVRSLREGNLEFEEI